MVMALGLMTTTVMFLGLRRLEQERIDSDFKQRGERYVAVIEDGLDNTLQALKETNRLFATFAPGQPRTVSRFHRALAGAPSVHPGVQLSSARVRDRTCGLRNGYTQTFSALCHDRDA
jgi:hypothetical protein